jgi:outer membrane protein OmpA-like peptidoglycan-associated protein
MSFNLLDAAKGLFTNELIGKASAHLGESESGVTKALGGIVPSLLTGFLSKSQESGGADAIFNAAKAQNDSGILSNLGGFFGGDNSGGLMEKGAGLLSGLLGGSKLDMLGSLISSFSGVKSSTTSSLLSLAGPALMGLLGKHASSSGLNAGGLASFLGGQKDAISAAIPSGLNLSSAFDGFSGAAKSVTGAATTAAHSVVDEVESTGGGAMKFLLPLLLLGAIAAGIWYFKNGCNKGAGTEGHSSTEASHDANGGKDTVNNGGISLPSISIDSVSGLVKYDVGAPITIDLPGGVKLENVAAKGFEAQLVEFIKTGTIDTVNKKANWIDMYDVQFVSGNNTYTGVSAQQVKNMAAILKAYPNVAVKIGGYTDKSGDAAKNLALSQTRATKVKTDLIAGGAAAAQIIEAQGYGSEFATAEATDKLGMARDRKVAVKVAKK